MLSNELTDPSLIDIESATILNTLPTRQGPHELVVTKDGLWAISTDFVGGDSLTVFDLKAQKVTRTIKLPDYPGPHGIRILNNQKEVAFTSGKSQHLVVVNFHTGKIVKAIKTNQDTSHMVAIAENENFAFTTNIRSNTISKLDLKKGTLVKQINTELMPEAINITANSKEIWYGANREGLITVLDNLHYKILAQFEGCSFPYRVLFSHNEKYAIVPDFQNHYVRFFDRENKQ